MSNHPERADSRDDPNQGSITQLQKLANHSAVRYLVVGGFSFALDLGLLALFKELLGWQLWIATATAFVTSFVFNYTAQRMFSFNSEAPHGRALVKYVILVAFNSAATVVIVGLVDLTPAGWATGKVLSTAATTFWNYFAYKNWVFAHTGQEPSTSAN